MYPDKIMISSEKYVIRNLWQWRDMPYFQHWIQELRLIRILKHVAYFNQFLIRNHHWLLAS